MDTTFIYCLTESDTRTIRYFGKANSPKGRLAEHIREAKRNIKKYPAYRWIRKRLKVGKRPDVHVLCEVPKNDWERFERAFIALGKKCGFALLNVTDGGEAGPVLTGEKNPWFGKKGPQHPAFGRKVPQEERNKTSERFSGEKHPFFGKKRSPESIEKQRRHHAHRKPTEKELLDMSARMLGEKNPRYGKPGTRLGQKFGPASPEYCASLRRKQFGASSSFYGVALRRSTGKWLARISISGKEKSLGAFSSEVEAAEVHDIAAKIHHGAYAVLNFPD